MLINKITVGYVVQIYDTETKRWLHQEFIAGDEVTWEDQSGGYLDEDNPASDDYLPFEMKQPE